MDLPLKDASTDCNERHAISATELHAIEASRQTRLSAHEVIRPVAGIGLSGGGIRSATFVAGLCHQWFRPVNKTQKLSKVCQNDLTPFKRFDYMSTVSGGGYLGGLIGSLYCQHKDIEHVTSAMSDESSECLQYLRRNGRYLAGNTGERFTLLASYFRNLIWFHFLWLSALILLFLTIHLLNNKFFVLVSFEQTMLAIAFALFALSIVVYFLIKSRFRLFLQNPERIRQQIAETQGNLLIIIITMVLLYLINDIATNIELFSAVAISVGLFFALVLSSIGFIFGKAAGVAVFSITLAFLYLLYVSHIASKIILLDNKIVLCLYLPIAVINFLFFASLSFFYNWVNLTSLSPIYQARLRRAFLGAANPARFNTTRQAANKNPLKNVRRYHPHDDIPFPEYKPQKYGGPIHLINVTQNVTFSPNSTLWQPDRAGDHIDISSTKRANKVKQEFSLATWLAISGAAVSSAMGIQSQWYFNILFTLLNIRLGYWWGCKDDYLPFFRLSLSELTSYFSKKSRSIYLTDGGHFDNLGLYALLKRGVDRIVLIDAAADPNYQFSCLAQALRHARTDLNYDISETTLTEVKTLTATQGKIGNKIQQLNASKESGGRATKRACLLKAINRTTPDKICWILYVKTTITGTEDPDIKEYHHQHPCFPQQPTSDQFFDDVQWESYFRLGKHTGEDLSSAVLHFLR